MGDYNRNGSRGNFRNQSYERNMIGKLEVITEGTIEASVTADQGEQVPIETGLEYLIFKNMIIHKKLPNNTSTQRGRTNSANVQYGQRADIITDDKSDRTYVLQRLEKI